MTTSEKRAAVDAAEARAAGMSLEQYSKLKLIEVAVKIRGIPKTKAEIAAVKNFVDAAWKMMLANAASEGR